MSEVSERVSSASERANGRASGPVLESVFLVDLAHGGVLTFLALSVLRQSVEKMPSVQSLVATSSRPNISGAVMAFGFIRYSLCGKPHSVITWKEHKDKRKMTNYDMTK